ncbi:MAG: hypothetical protein OXF63_11675 [Anaerolineaceae bacterium]|nr:hypothetical protein [Anaerolineaceae bacterium]
MKEKKVSSLGAEPNNVDWEREFEIEMAAEARMQASNDTQLERVCEVLRKHGDDLHRAAEVANMSVASLQWWLDNHDEPKLARIWAKYNSDS